MPRPPAALRTPDFWITTSPGGWPALRARNERARRFLASLRIPVLADGSFAILRTTRERERLALIARRVGLTAEPLQ